jgi:hypothetical protein
MLIDNEIEIEIIQTKYYKDKGYDVNYGDIIKVKIIDLPLGSDKIVNVKCDICGNEYKIPYKKYVRNISNMGYYSCKGKCASMVKEFL